MNRDIETKLRATERLVHLFRWERTIYLVVAGLALAALLTSIGVLMVQETLQVTALTLIFGCAGMIIFAMGRILRVWEEAYRLTNSESGKRIDEK